MYPIFLPSFLLSPLSPFLFIPSPLSFLFLSFLSLLSVSSFIYSSFLFLSHLFILPSFYPSFLPSLLPSFLSFIFSLPPVYSIFFPSSPSSHFFYLQAMGDLAAEGGKIFWVAPSGGRDRPDETTGKFVVAPFDMKALDMFKLVCMQSRKVTNNLDLN